MKNAEINNKEQESKSIDSLEEGKQDQHINSDKIVGGLSRSNPTGGDSGKTSAGEA